MSRTENRRWQGWLLIVLTFEKIIQHATVTAAFLTDWQNIRGTVEIDYRWLMITGAIIGVLFAVALVGLLCARLWSMTLLTMLALADIVGEFIAQGTLSITVTISFIVAILILILAQWFARTDTSLAG